MDKKIEELQTKINNLKNKNKENLPLINNPFSSIDVASELVAGVLVGVIVGLMMDNLFTSRPLFLIICIILAISAAFRSIWKKYIK